MGLSEEAIRLIVDLARSHEGHVLSGVLDHADYRYQCGIIFGLQHAESIVRELSEQEE